MVGVGSIIGSIRLDEKLGEGGMGTVYLGVDSRLERQVAVKAVRAEHRMDEQARTRLLREARILSQLEHPNICRVYDLLEADGEDFIVLELVRGNTLRDLIPGGVPRERALEIAAQVAGALVAAHGLSVVHRDLKPENIAVSEDGEVKVLDFGIARSAPAAANADVTTDSSEQAQPSADGVPGSLTRTGALMGTPRYMSPEQIRGETATAASDIYSFGLLLEELLTGESPCGEADTLTSIYQRAVWGEPASAGRLGPSLRDLIAAMTAIRPQDRPTAVSVAERLQWVRERPRRLLRRTGIAVVAAAVTVAALVSTVGFITTKRALAQVEASEQEARRAQSEAEEVSGFLQGMLVSADPAREGRDVRVAEVLDHAVDEAHARFSDHPVLRADVLTTLGNTYRALGLHQRALPPLEQGLALRRAHLGPAHPETLTCMDRLAVTLDGLGDTERAAAIMKEAVDLALESLHEDHPVTLTLLSDYSTMLQRLGRYDEAEPIARRALEGKRRVLGPEHNNTLNAEESLVLLTSRRGRYEEAVTLLRPIIEVRRRVFGADHPDTLISQSNLAYLLGRRLGRYDEALEVLEEIIDTQRRVLGPEHPQTLRTLEHRAETLRRAGDLDYAEASLRELLAIRRRVLGDDHPDTLATGIDLAKAMIQSGHPAEAEAMLRTGIAGLERVRGPEHPDTLAATGILSMLLVLRGVYPEAEAMLRRTLPLRRKMQGEDHPETLANVTWLGLAVIGAGRPSEAAPILQDAVRRGERALGPTHSLTVRATAALSRALRQSGRPDEAEQLLRSALEAAATSDPNQPSVRALRLELAALLRDSGRTEEAEALE